jgi:hypothetical protein
MSIAPAKYGRSSAERTISLPSPSTITYNEGGLRFQTNAEADRETNGNPL